MNIDENWTLDPIVTFDPTYVSRMFDSTYNILNMVSEHHS